jgi:hypothetical protein
VWKGFEIFVMGYNPTNVIWGSRTYFLLCNLLCYANVLVFYVLGLDFHVVANESIFWITKSLISCFCVTIRLELFNNEFYWFFVVCVCYARDLIINKCQVVVCCLCYYSCLCKSFICGANIVCSRILVCLLGENSVLYLFFM